MAEKARTTTRKGEHIVTYVGSLPDGTHIVEHPDGRLERRKGKTNWEKLRNLTDAEIDASIADDPDWDFNEADWSEAVLVIPPKKQAISIRVDQDVLDFFKTQGPGYQRRINAVLRSYMEQTKSPRPKKRA